MRLLLQGVLGGARTRQSPRPPAAGRRASSPWSNLSWDVIPECFICWGHSPEYAIGSFVHGYPVMYPGESPLMAAPAPGINLPRFNLPRFNLPRFNLGSTFSHSRIFGFGFCDPPPPTTIISPLVEDRTRQRHLATIIRHVRIPLRSRTEAVGARLEPMRAEPGLPAERPGWEETVRAHVPHSTAGGTGLRTVLMRRCHVSSVLPSHCTLAMAGITRKTRRRTRSSPPSRTASGRSPPSRPSAPCWTTTAPKPATKST
jgi:hypothetical protein